MPGTLLVLASFAVLIGSGLAVAASTRDPFGRLVACGIVAMLATQCIINTAMTVGLAPITGLTLPLVSYGGSSLVMTLFSISLLLNIGWRRELAATGDPFRFRE